MKKAKKSGMDIADPYIANDIKVPECGSIMVCLSHIVSIIKTAKII